MSLPRVDYYAALGVYPIASDTSIRAAFRRLALLRHPDKNPENPDATAEFQELNDAYATLSDPVQRQRYDAHIRSGSQEPFSSAPDNGRTYADSPPPHFTFHRAHNRFYGNYDEYRAFFGSEPPFPIYPQDDISRHTVRQLNSLIEQLNRQRANALARVNEAVYHVKETEAAIKKLQDASERYKSEKNAHNNSWIGFLLNNTIRRAQEKTVEEEQEEKRQQVIVQLKEKLDGYRALRMERDGKLKNISEEIQRHEIDRIQIGMSLGTGRYSYVREERRRRANSFDSPSEPPHEREPEETVEQKRQRRKDFEEDFNEHEANEKAFASRRET